MTDLEPIHVNATFPTPDELKAGLRAWAEQHSLRPAQFGRDMSYLDPSYGWGLLRGKTVVTMDCLGRFAVVYGGEAVQELLTLASVSTETG